MSQNKKNSRAGRRPEAGTSGAEKAAPAASQGARVRKGQAVRTAASSRRQAQRAASPEPADLEQQPQEDHQLDLSRPAGSQSNAPAETPVAAADPAPVGASSSSAPGETPAASADSASADSGNRIPQEAPTADPAPAGSALPLAPPGKDPHAVAQRVQAKAPGEPAPRQNREDLPGQKAPTRLAPPEAPNFSPESATKEQKRLPALTDLPRPSRKAPPLGLTVRKGAGTRRPGKHVPGYKSPELRQRRRQADVRARIPLRRSVRPEPGSRQPGGSKRVSRMWRRTARADLSGQRCAGVFAPGKEKPAQQESARRVLYGQGAQKRHSSRWQTQTGGKAPSRFAVSSGSGASIRDYLHLPAATAEKLPPASHSSSSGTLEEEAEQELAESAKETLDRAVHSCQPRARAGPGTSVESRQPEPPPHGAEKAREDIPAGRPSRAAPREESSPGARPEINKNSGTSGTSSRPEVPPALATKSACPEDLRERARQICRRRWEQRRSAKAGPVPPDSGAPIDPAAAAPWPLPDGLQLPEEVPCLREKNRKLPAAGETREVDPEEKSMPPASPKGAATCVGSSPSFSATPRQTEICGAVQQELPPAPLPEAQPAEQPEKPMWQPDEAGEQSQPSPPESPRRQERKHTQKTKSAAKVSARTPRQVAAGTQAAEKTAPGISCRNLPGVLRARRQAAKKAVHRSLQTAVSAPGPASAASVPEKAARRAWKILPEPLKSSQLDWLIRVFALAAAAAFLCFILLIVGTVGEYLAEAAGLAGIVTMPDAAEMRASLESALTASVEARRQAYGPGTEVRIRWNHSDLGDTDEAAGAGNYLDVLAVFGMQWNLKRDICWGNYAELEQIFLAMNPVSESVQDIYGEDGSYERTVVTIDVHESHVEDADVIRHFDFSREQMQKMVSWIRPPSEPARQLWSLLGLDLAPFGAADFSAIQGTAPFGSAGAVIREAQRYVGWTYSQSLRMTDGYADCSSLVWRVFRRFGIDFGSSAWPPTAAEMAAWCEKQGLSLPFAGTGGLLPGDVLFWGGSGNGRYKGIYHTGLYAGGGMVIEASSGEGLVVCRSIWGLSSICLTARPVAAASFSWDGSSPLQTAGGQLLDPASFAMLPVPADFRQSGLVADYTPYLRSWSAGTNQRRVYEYWQSAGRSQEGLLATLQGYYLVAVSPRIGRAGDLVLLELDGGDLLACVVADEKGEDRQHEWGHRFGSGISLVEWEACCPPRAKGDPAIPQDQKEILAVLTAHGWSGRSVRAYANLGSFFR